MMFYLVNNSLEKKKKGQYYITRI